MQQIRLICLCGRQMVLPEKYAGEHVQCPDCRAMLHIPTQEEDLSLTRFFCECGQRLKARTRTAGRYARCPRCERRVKVPQLDRQSVLEEKFLLDDNTGVVQLVRDASASASAAPVVPETRSDDKTTFRSDDVLDLEPEILQDGVGERDA